MLINCVAYEDGTKLNDCPIDDPLESPGCFVRVAMKDATTDELADTSCLFMWWRWRRAGWF